MGVSRKTHTPRKTQPEHAQRLSVRVVRLLQRVRLPRYTYKRRSLSFGLCLRGGFSGWGSQNFTALDCAFPWLAAAPIEPVFSCEVQTGAPRKTQPEHAQPRKTASSHRTREIGIF